MKAFVIKEDELYLRNKTDFVKHLFAAKIFLLKEDAENYKEEMFDNENCKVVPVTILEGDLEQQLAKKDKEIEGIDSNLTYKQIQIDNLEQENKELKEQELEEKSSYLESVVEADKVNYAKYKKQLAEKDKEIERLKYQLLYSQAQAPKEEIDEFNNIMLAQAIPYESQIRKQVCDEIRQYCKEHFVPVKNELGYITSINRDDFYNFLDQIEEGDE